MNSKAVELLLFQPTLPARGATRQGLHGNAHAGDFNPRSPHGERLIPDITTVLAKVISTHAPRTGSDDDPA